MADERRQHKRHPPEVLRIRFEEPSGGGRTEAVAWDAAFGGMFLETDKPLDEGALVTIEIETASAKVSADARVLWKREAKEDDDHPQGMAIRFLDLTDDVKAALTNAIVGKEERTILGVGGATKDTTTPGITAAAVAPPAPTPRETQIGVAPPANEPATDPKPPSLSEPSVPLELLNKKSEPKVEAKPLETKAVAQRDPDQTQKRVARARDPEPPPAKKKGPSGTLIFLLALIVLAGAGYGFRDEVAKMMAPAAGPTASTTGTSEPTASASATTPTPTASTTEAPAASAVASASATASASASPSATTTAAAAASASGKNGKPLTPCELAGGECVGLTPTACPNGHFTDATKLSCQTETGMGCCMPNAPVKDAGHKDAASAHGAHDAGKPAPKHSGHAPH